jgi:hypothetical protein
MQKQLPKKCRWFCPLTRDDRVLMLLDRSVNEVYALEVEYR